MASLPIACEEQQAPCLMAESCPYSASEIAGLLKNGQYHYLTDEPEVDFSVDEAPVAKQHRDGRTYWVQTAADTLGRVWFVLVGSGRSPFDPQKFAHRWMLAETNDFDTTPEQFLVRQISEQDDHDLQKRQSLH